MTRGLRWRIVVLQAGLLAVFGFVAGFLFWAHGFTSDQVTSQLAAQQITFPAADDKSIKALPAEDAAAMSQYAGQQLTNGDQALVYADNFINVHLQEIAGGKTYSQLSAESMANPTDTKLSGQVATVFKGTTLRGMLLNAYGWWTVGRYALYAAIGFVVAGVLVLASFLFEVVAWRKSAAATESRPVLAGAGA